MAWRYGALRERSFLLIYLTFIASTVGLTIVTGFMIVQGNWPAVAMVTFFMAVSALPAFEQPFMANLYSASYLREGVKQGWLPDAKNHAFYLELSRYKETFGTSGSPPAELRWGITYWLIYFATIAGSIVLTIALYPVVGDLAWLVFAAIEVPVALACYVLYGRNTTKEFKEAERLGFRLWELRPGADRSGDRRSQATRKQ
jgi:hypothetical protein